MFNTFYWIDCFIIGYEFNLCFYLSINTFIYLSIPLSLKKSKEQINPITNQSHLKTDTYIHSILNNHFQSYCIIARFNSLISLSASSIKFAPFSSVSSCMLLPKCQYQYLLFFSSFCSLSRYLLYFFHRYCTRY